jgi:hypothetical protein
MSSIQKERANRIRKVARQKVKQVTYSVVVFAIGGARMLSGRMSREEADGYAFGFNGAAIADGGEFRAAVIADSDQ